MIILVWGIAVSLAEPFAAIESPGRINLETHSFQVRLAVLGHQDVSASQGTTLTWDGEVKHVTDLYRELHLLSLCLNPSHRQLWILELPFQYTAAVISEVDKIKTWTLGNAQLQWKMGLPGSFFSGTVFSFGFSVPTAAATQSNSGFWISDLSALPRGGTIGTQGSVEGAPGLGVLLELDQSWNLPIRTDRQQPIQIRLLGRLRQPVSTQKKQPFTLIEGQWAILVPLPGSWQFVTSGGQSRAWLPNPLLIEATPSASHLQASLGLAPSASWYIAVGGRYNPFWNQEYESYRIIRNEANRQSIAIKVTSQPQAQGFFETVYHFGFDKKTTYAKPTVRKMKPDNELDTDGDGIQDVVDLCPKIPEDKDGFRDQDGCPDMDNDHDGIEDGIDLCPNDGEDKDGFQDRDGCPDLDNDQDGIPDTQDRCPNEKEIINFYRDEDGCPDEKPDRVRVNDLIDLRFESSQIEPTPESHFWLDSLVDKLIAYPGTNLKITGYCDLIEANSLELSLSRATMVVKYLEKRGIAADRLEAKGLGAKNPYTHNRSARSRAMNRRVTVEPR